MKTLSSITLHSLKSEKASKGILRKSILSNKKKSAEINLKEVILNYAH